MIEIGDLAIEPEMNAGDGRSLELRQLSPQGSAAVVCGSIRAKTSNGTARYHEIKAFPRPNRSSFTSIGFGQKRLDAAAQSNRRRHGR